MRDATDHDLGCPTAQNAWAGFSDIHEFDPHAPPTQPFSNGDEDTGDGRGVTLGRFPAIVAGWLGMVLMVATLGAMLGHPLARYEIVRWGSFGHARQVYDLAHAVVP